MLKHLGPGCRAAFCTTVALLCLLFSAGTHLLAQTDTGRIQGSVADQTGALIPGATITVTNTDTNAVQAAVSDGSGSFSIAALQRGNYKAEVKAQGFASQTQNFILAVSQVQALNFKLSAGAADTVVDVTSAAPLVDSATSSIGEVIQGRQITELPLNGRNFTQLALLAPGVTRGNYGNGASGVGGDAETFRNNTSGGGSLTTNGVRPQANNFILDGIDNNEALVNTLVFFPNIEGTEEFRINTSVAPAEFGRAGGAIVQSSIKSGTNAIHGSAFEFARSSLFDASPNYQFQGAGAAPVLPFKRNTFGGSLGGPILKDRLFIFGDYQGLRENQPLNPELITVPTTRMKTGDFSELIGQGTTQVPAVTTATLVSPTGCRAYTLSSGRVVTSNNQLNYGNNAGTGSLLPDSGAIFDPLTCAQFPGNVIPASRQNPAAVKYLNAYPGTNIPGLVNGTQNNFRTIRSDIRHSNAFDVRLDYRLRSSDQIFLRSSYDNSAFIRTSRLPLLPAGFASGSNNVHARGYDIGETHTFTANILNEFRIGYNRYTLTNAPVSTNLPISANLGIVNANRTSALGGGALIGGYNNQLEYTGDYGLYAVPENTYQINDAVSYIHGHHAFKFGGSGIRRDVSFFRPIAGKGFFQIANGDFTGYQPSELLAGFVDNYSLGAQSGFFGTRNYEVGGFVQDDWKLNNHLTLNLGFRYDLFTFPTEEHNRQAALNPLDGTLQLAGVAGVPRSIINNNFANFAPRVGFAYDPYGTGKTVLRGGYGIFYFQDRGGIDNQLGQQVPFGGSVTYAASQGYRIAFTGQAPQNTLANTINGTPVATQALPQPGYPNFNPAIPPAGINVFAVNRTEKTPSVEEYNLQVQQQMGPRGVFTIGYVGDKGTHLSSGYNYNTKPLGAPATQANAFPTLGQVVYNINNGVSRYNSLQTQFNYRAARGLTLTSSYTWARNIDDANGYLGFYAVSDLYPYDSRLNKGNSSLDIRHSFVVSALADLPVGRGRYFGANMNRSLDLVVGGWQMNTIVTAQTGSPFSIVYPSYGGTYSLRANVTGPILQPHSIRGQYFTGNFSQPAAGSDGNVARNSLYGPGFATGDVSLFKTLHFTDRFGTELRAEVYNVTNTPQFTNPSGNPSDGNFGRVSATRLASERQMQMAVRFLF